MSVKVLLKSTNLLKQSPDLIFYLGLNLTELTPVLAAQLVLVNSFDKNLTLLETCPHLVRQPSYNRSATSCLRVFGVVDDVLLHPAPVLMSELEGCMNVAQHQEARVAVLKSKFLKLCFSALSS